MKSWDRVPAADFERYLDRLMNPPPDPVREIRVRRLARKLALAGLHTSQRPFLVYDELAKTGDQDLTNLVAREMGADF